MNPGCRAMGLFLVVLALFQSLTVVVYVRYFSVWGNCQCGRDNEP